MTADGATSLGSVDPSVANARACLAHGRAVRPLPGDGRRRSLPDHRPLTSLAGGASGATSPAHERRRPRTQVIEGDLATGSAWPSSRAASTTSSSTALSRARSTASAATAAPRPLSSACPAARELPSCKALAKRATTPSSPSAPSAGVRPIHHVAGEVTKGPAAVSPTPTSPAFGVPQHRHHRAGGRARRHQGRQQHGREAPQRDRSWPGRRGLELALARRARRRPGALRARPDAGRRREKALAAYRANSTARLPAARVRRRDRPRRDSRSEASTPPSAPRSPNWCLERMARVDCKLLRIGAGRSARRRGAAVVVIDEAVEFARAFGAERLRLRQRHPPSLAPRRRAGSRRVDVRPLSSPTSASTRLLRGGAAFLKTSGPWRGAAGLRLAASAAVG